MEESKKPKLPPLRKRWECAAKALDMFKGTVLGEGALLFDGEYCAVGAMLAVSGVEFSETVRRASEERTLYQEFEKRFGLGRTAVYNVNDESPADTGEERLLYMRVYTKARAKGYGDVKARILATKAMERSRKDD